VILSLGDLRCHKKAQKAHNQHLGLTPKAFATKAGEGTPKLMLGLTPKAFANPSPGLERQRQPWD